MTTLKLTSYPTRDSHDYIFESLGAVDEDNFEDHSFLKSTDFTVGKKYKLGGKFPVDGDEDKFVNSGQFHTLQEVTELDGKITVLPKKIEVKITDFDVRCQKQKFWQKNLGLCEIVVEKKISGGRKKGGLKNKSNRRKSNRRKSNRRKSNRRR